MNEAQTRRLLINPALTNAGWTDWVPEYAIAPGRIGSDSMHHNSIFADYLLRYNDKPVAVVEAKREGKDFDAGETQAREYAERLGLRYAFSTNGHRVLQIDLATQETADFPIEEFPTPQALLQKLNEVELSELEKVCANIPYSRAGGKGIRYYQERAVEAVIHKIGVGEDRALLTLATGTGKTFIAYQLVHKLTEAKWKRNSLGKEMPRVLFITDRNILANQAYEGFYFPTGMCFRYEAGTELRLTRQIYFTLFQTLLGENGDETKYEQFPEDFFDIVIIDECHRGGANDESEWRKILKHFKGAFHLGLTATPKADVNGSTYEYFGHSAYTYTLQQGIEDGYLSPYRVERCRSTLENYKLEDGDIINFPEEIDDDKVYSNDAIEKLHILIKERDQHFVEELFKRMPLDQKAIVFCVNQKHARRIARVIRSEARKHGITNPHYCETVTADAGTYGDMQLRLFRNNDLKYPTILTTSEKLSTGVDASNIRSIVFYRNAKNMVEFKQIIGRGTRTHSGKPYFKIYDFVGATDRFKDDDWGREDVPCSKCHESPCICNKPQHKICEVCGESPCVCEKTCPVCGLPKANCTCPKEKKPDIVIKLSSGRDITAVWKNYIFFDDQMINIRDFLERFVSAVKTNVEGVDDLRAKWSDEESRNEFLTVLADAGFSEDSIRDVQKQVERQEYDVFDVMLDLAYNVAPVTRAMRVEMLSAELDKMYEPRRRCAEIILANYVEDGVWKLTRKAFNDIMKQLYNGNLVRAGNDMRFSTTDEMLSFFSTLQHNLYAA